uniref:Carboxypeptidase regulatory-like domain-containing protein n=1 Tax=Meloidogyne incognita TaxID=6306 RepID=A0A914NRZ0_MELIC
MSLHPRTKVQPFLIPIYNKGKYLVEIDAADGYVFEPELYEIEIGNNGGCSEELNFNLAGLKISGKILDGEDSSLVLGLFKQEDGELVEKTIIDKKGKYNFVAWPGKYVISPFSGSTKCLNQDKMEIEVGTTPLTIKPDLQIEGYSLEVNVVDEKGDPFLSTNVVLQSDKQIKFENLPLSAEQPITFNEGQNWFYKFNTNSSGSTLINCLPPGKYVVNAEQKVLNFGEANFDEKFVDMNFRTTKVTISVKSFQP